MEKEQAKDKDRSKPNFLERLTGAKRESASEDEIRELVDDTEELAEDEKRMIRDIISLGDTTVNEICTPRVDVMLVRDDETGRTALERMRGTGYSRLPVCRDDIDDVIGIVNYKDLIGPLMDGSIDDCVVKFMYDAMFVPETKDVIPLLGEMQASHQQMAIVVDEYGGTQACYHRGHNRGDSRRDSRRVGRGRRTHRASWGGRLARRRPLLRRGRNRAGMARPALRRLRDRGRLAACRHRLGS